MPEGAARASLPVQAQTSLPVQPSSPQEFGLRMKNPVPVGTNPQNSVLLLLQRLLAQNTAQASEDVPMTAEQAGALGIPVKK